MIALANLTDQIRFRGMFLDSTGDRARLVESSLKQLPSGNTLIRVEFAAFTEEDASRVSGLPLSGVRKWASSWRAVAGLVVATEGHRLRIGDRVVFTATAAEATGWLGCSEYLRACDSGIARLPSDLSTQSAALVGHPGYMAMLCVCALEESDGAPDKGPVLVTQHLSALGRAVTLILDRLGYQTEAAPNHDVLTGCPSVAAREGRWGAVIDAMSGAVLSTALNEIRYGGIVIVAGATERDELTSSRQTFLSRAIRLVGVDSETTPLTQRDRTWRRIGIDYPVTSVDLLSARTVRLDEVEALSHKMVRQKRQGRVVVDLRA